MGVTNADFLGEGTAASAFAPRETPEQRAAREKLEREARAAQVNRAAEELAVRNAPSVQRAGRSEQWKRDHPDQGGKYETLDQHRRQVANNHGLMGNLIRDPLSLGIVAAPWIITGGAAAAGALGTGAAVGGGGAAAAPAITTGGAVTAPTLAAPAAAAAAPTIGAVGTVASPFAATPAMAAAATPAAAGMTTGQMIGAGISGASLGLDAYGLIKSQTDSKAEKALLAKQEQLAKETAARREQVQQEGMNRLGTQLLAFNPQNQMMAQMFGPDAAFNPQQMGAMAADPGAMSQEEYDRKYQESLRTGQPIQVSPAEERRMEANKRRQQQVTAGAAPLGPGPAPLQQVAPQAARRF